MSGTFRAINFVLAPYLYFYIHYKTSIGCTNTHIFVEKTPEQLTIRLRARAFYLTIRLRARDFYAVIAASICGKIESE